MTNGTFQTFLTAFGLVCGHFVYQAIFIGMETADWGAATERSFFTLFAVAATWWMVRKEFKAAT